MMVAAAGVDEGIGSERSRPLERGEVACVVVGYGRGSNALVEALRGEGVRCVGIESYSRALKEIGRWEPDLILVGGTSDSGALRGFLSRTRRGAPDAMVLYLAECQSVSRAVSAIEWGADDVVCPPHSISTILMRKHLLRRFGRRRTESKVSRRIAVGTLVVDLATRQVQDGGRPFTLSGREFELLVRLMEANGEVVKREELFMDIWGEEAGSEAALDATVHRLRRRLEAQCSKPGLITTIRGIGYRLEVEALDAHPG